MDLLRTSIKIGKTIRNISRLREITTILARNGFAEFVSIGVTALIPNFLLPKSFRAVRAEWNESESKDLGKLVGQRLRKSFEEMGPTFIKFGQLLGTREDIFNSAFVEEIQLLRDQVSPIPFSSMKPILEESMGKKVEEVFTNIDNDPIGTASIGVVYKGTLKNGKQVVIKMRRPGIEKTIEVDFSIMKLLVFQAEKVSEDIRALGVPRILDDFFAVLQNELNFNIEALNCERFQKIMENRDRDGMFVVPHLFSEFTKDNILVMEYCEGIPFSDKKAIAPKKEHLRDTFHDGMGIFMKSFLSDGFFHADLHGGNFILMQDDRIALIDFGLMGSLGKDSRKSFIAIVYSLLNCNYENMVYEFLDVAEYESIPDIESLCSDVKASLIPYMGLSTQQVDYTRLFQHILRVMADHKIYLPREWFIVFRALTTLDGVSRSLGIDFDPYAAMENDIEEIIKENFSKDSLIEDGIWLAKDAVGSARIIPRHIKWFTRELAKRGYAFDVNIKGLSSNLPRIQRSISNLGSSIIVCALILSGTMLIPDNVNNPPLLSWIAWGLATIIVITRSIVGWKKSRCC